MSTLSADYPVYTLDNQLLVPENTRNVSKILDTLISHRPYRSIPYDNRTALEEIIMMAERNQLSWNIVKAFVALNRKSKPHFSVCNVSREKRGTPPPENKYGIIIQETI